MPLKETDKRIEKLFGQWKKLQPLKKEYREKLDEKIRLEWNFNSNHIEGNTLNYNETKTLLVDGKEEGIHPKRDYMEINAHDLAVNKIKELAKDKERNLTEADIRKLNQIILKEPFLKDAITPDGQKTRKKIIPGKYKTGPNHVQTESGEIFKFAEPGEVSPKMKELMEWFNKEMKNPSLSISSFLAELHHRFIVIHPFDDGNGRIARLWVNYVLLRFGYPPLVVKSKDKRNYFAALQRADGGDMDAFAVYLGKTLIFWLEIGIKAGKGEDIKEMGDIHKEVDIFIRNQQSTGLKNLRPLSLEVVERLYENYLITIFQTFEGFFESFTKLFFSKEIRLNEEHHATSGERGKAILEFISKHNWKDDKCGALELQFFYKKYKGESEEEFDMDAILSFDFQEFKYYANIYCKSRIRGNGNRAFVKREKLYTQPWSESEIREFVEEGKEVFFKLLKESTKK